MRSNLGRTLRIIPFLLLFFVGAIKVLVGLSRGRPVEFLLLLLILTVVVAVIAWQFKTITTARGKQFVKDLRTRNAALKHNGWRKAKDRIICIHTVD